MKITILLPYSESTKYYKKWAHEEETINFDNPFEAKRCTLCFAAEELSVYLNNIGHEAEVSDEAGEFNIIIDSEETENEEFDISMDGKNLYLKGCGRAGALYAVYELLEAQGVRWYAPKLEYVPSNTGELIIPDLKHYRYDLTKGRGFHSEGVQKESLSLELWMARNRMNRHACYPNIKNFQKKLCINCSAGGHIFEAILNPDNIEEDGRYYIDAHKDWYGKYADKETTSENALLIQPCFSNTELLDRMADLVIEKAKNKWANENVLELAGFDTWGKTCNCEKCQQIGNGSDKTLRFISHVRKRVDEATKKGELKRKIYLSFDAYEGTNTIEPPLNPVPDNLIKAGDYAMFAPILRCYQHDFDDTSCYRNSPYKKHLEGWIATGLAIGINEYYDVSKFEDLPLVFIKKIYNDIRYYINSGVDNLVYMHVPMVEWGVCTTTQYLLANITRDKNCDYYKLLKEYYSNVFGDYASEAEEAYSKIEKAMELAASWRCWGDESILCRLTWEWDGKIPEKPLYQDPHFNGKATEYGYETIKLLEEALDIMRNIKENEINSLPDYKFGENIQALNPVEQSKIKSQTMLLDKLNEDIRGILYGIDMQSIITLFVDYHEKLYEGDLKAARELLLKIKTLGNKMSEDTNGVCFAGTIADFEVRDVLKRSQLKELYYKCLANKEIVEL